MSAIGVDGYRTETYHSPHLGGRNTALIAGILAPLALPAAVFAIDSFTNRFTRPQSVTESEMEIIGTDGDYLAVAGLACSSAAFVAERFASLGSIDYVNYSQRDGITDRKLLETFGSYFESRNASANGDKGIKVLAHSAGLRTFLDATLLCRQAGVDVPHIDAITAISSPMYVGDVNLATSAKVAAHIPLHGGKVTKHVGESITAILQEDRHDIVHLARVALSTLKRPVHGAEPELWFSQIRRIAASRPYADNAFEGIITPRTDVRYLMDTRDPIVHTERARRHLADFCMQYGAIFTPLQVDGLRHARMEALSVEHIVAQQLNQAYTAA
jgi:hypothetical protein